MDTVPPIYVVFFVLWRRLRHGGGEVSRQTYLLLFSSIRLSLLPTDLLLLLTIYYY